MAEKRRGLGRGLGALIPSAPKEENTQGGSAKKAKDDVAQPAQKVVTTTSSKEKKGSPVTQHHSATPPSAVQQASANKSVSSAKTSSAGAVQKAGSKNVSRETSKTTTRGTKKNRMDMGTALRNTTSTRRPVDFFFGEDSEDSGSDLTTVPGAQFAEVNVKDIHPNRKQPRTEFDEQDMEELVHSIKEIGVLQPIVVRPSREQGTEKYELVMGERRWRATQRAGLTVIPAIIRETHDVDLLRDALLENLHRSQLNPIEEAAAYQQLLEEFETTQDQLAQRIGRSRPQISNTLRLLKLPPLVQRRVASGALTSGHARALLGLKSQAEMEKIAQQITQDGLSVRAVEHLVASATEETPAERKTAQPQKHHERLDYVAEAFADKLDTNVKINLGAHKGKMTIEFASVEDLNRIISVLDPGMKK